MTLAEIKRQVRAGQMYDVTNHYIRRPSHPAYGTIRRPVTRVTGSRFYLAYESGKEPYVDWPKAAQVSSGDDGVTELRGGGAGQHPGEPYLTLAPVPDPEESAPEETPDSDEAASGASAEPVAETITGRVRAALESNGITPDRFAEALRRPVKYAEAVMSGESRVPGITVAVAAELAGVNVGYLITGEDTSLRIIGPCQMPDGD